MSPSLPPLFSIARAQAERRDNILSPLDMWSDCRRRVMAPSSSPARSSSPPRTPCSSHNSQSYACIHSSPTNACGLDSPPLNAYSGDPSPWNIKYPPRIALPCTHRHGARYPQYDPYGYPPSSEIDLEDLVDDEDISLPEIDSETTSDSTPGHGSIYFSDSEEELALDDTEDDEKLTFGYSSLRSTSFRVSSERGQWKDDPMALTASATSNLTVRLRQSVPTPSRQPSENPSNPSRPVSVPLPTPFEREFMHTEVSHDTLDVCDLEGVPPRTRLVTPAPTGLPEYSSPLPLSSPMLSPMSGCVSSMSRSVSPLSLPPSSPLMMPSSPFSGLNLTLPMVEDFSSDDTASCNLSDSSAPHDDLPAVRIDDDKVPTTLFPHQDTLEQSTPSGGNPLVAEPQTVFDNVTLTASVVDASTSTVLCNGSTASSVASSSHRRYGSIEEKDTIVKGLEDDGECLRNKHDSSISQTKKKKRAGKVPPLETCTKRKADSLDGSISDALTKKRRQGNTGGDNIASSSSLTDSLPQPKAPKGRKRRAGTQAPSSPSRKDRVAQLFALESPQKSGTNDSVPEEIDAEIKGLIIECMATSRASSMPVSLLSRMVLQAHPNLKGQKTEKEWRRVMCRVLVNGTAGRGSGVFGKVDSSGKDEADRPLEAQWFYVPELDEDQDRAALIRSMMPRPGKRSVTKQYKQYYWRPLEKISRWDPEDEL